MGDWWKGVRREYRWNAVWSGERHRKELEEGGGMGVGRRDGGLGRDCCGVLHVLLIF